MVQVRLYSHQLVPNVADLNESFSDNNSSIIKPPMKESLFSSFHSSMNFIWFVQAQIFWSAAGK